MNDSALSSREDKRAARLNRLLGAGRDRVRVLVAPSGWGKTTAASEYARSLGVSVVWLDAAGGRMPATKVVSELLKSTCALDNVAGGQAGLGGRSVRELAETYAEAIRSRDRTGTRNPCVVVDDLGFDAAGCLDDIVELSRMLSQTGVVIVVTSRDTGLATSNAARQVHLMTSGDLRLTGDEAVEILCGVDGLSAARAKEIALECSGHLALALLMARFDTSRDDHGGVNRRLECSAWLDTFASLQLLGPDAQALMAAALLKSGATKLLTGAGVREPTLVLARLGHVLPLIRLTLSEGHEANADSFDVHDIAELWIRSQFDTRDDKHRELLELVCRILATEGRTARAAVLLCAHGADVQRVSWLCEHGSAMLAGAQSGQLCELLAGTSLHLLMDDPSLLVLWGDALLCEGDASAAAAKAAAAAELSRHRGDNQTLLAALVLQIEALQRQDNHEPCRALVDDVVTLASGRFAVSQEARVRALVAAGTSASNCGELRVAAAALGMAIEASQCDGVAPSQSSRLRVFSAVVNALVTGDFALAVSAIGSLVTTVGGHRGDQTVAKGNLAACLIETGRVERAEGLLRSVLSDADAYLQSAFGVTKAAAIASAGKMAEAVEEFRRFERISVEVGCDTDMAANRVVIAPVLRAAGRLAEALELSERSFESLSLMDFLGLRRLAVIEVAASLLSLGDIAAARRWLQPVVDAGFDGNAYHALRAAMVLAECDRREGDIASGIARLAEHRDHVLTESSNWQMAMYCRAFPELLGMLAEAIGPADLPVHMVRMILPEHAERSLDASREFMDPGVWRALGVRLLGEQQFERLMRRNGRPLCHVRMLGGLEVSIGGRVVGERDWKKRKSRLLFAMLASRRGAEIARDQLLDALWPEMSEDRARNNFYVAWSAMKGTLIGTSPEERCPYVDSSRGRCRLVADSVRLDIDDFDDVLADLGAAEESGDAPMIADALERLSALYRGDLLPGDLYEDWFSTTREHYRYSFVDAMSRGSRALVAADDPCRALLYLRRALQIDPLREDLYQAALRAHLLAGQRSAAIETFLQCRTQLSEELGLDPSAETLSIYTDILAMEECPRIESFGLSTEESLEA